MKKLIKVSSSKLNFKNNISSVSSSCSRSDLYIKFYKFLFKAENMFIKSYILDIVILPSSKMS